MNLFWNCRNYEKNTSYKWKAELSRENYQAFALDPKSLRKKALIYKAFRDINNIRGYLRGMSLRIIHAIISFVKARKKKDLSMIMLRNISMACAIVALLSLERSMLGTYGDAGDRFSMTMTIISGACMFLIVVGIGVSMIIQAGKETT